MSSTDKLKPKIIRNIERILYAAGTAYPLPVATLEVVYTALLGRSGH